VPAAAARRIVARANELMIAVARPGKIDSGQHLDRLTRVAPDQLDDKLLIRGLTPII
jgi:hypothetical protein